jgi:hypothetical protein
VTKQVKDITVQKTIWRKFLEDGTEVHEVSDVDEYRNKGIQVYLQEGKRKAEPTFYVSIEDYTPARRTAQSVADKLAALTVGKDLTTMTAAELIALIA